MSNVLIIPVDFYPNSTGFANATLNLVNAVKKYHPEINLFVYCDTQLKDGEKEIDGIKVYRHSHYRAKYAYSRYKEICQIVDNENIDFILIETNTVFFLQNLLVRKYPEKVAVRIHSTADTETLLFRKGGLASRVFLQSARDFMSRCKIILCTNTYHQGFIYKYFYNNNVYDMWERSHFILPNTVPSVKYDSAKSIEPYFFALGKLSYDGYIQKGISDIIGAFYILKQKGVELPLEIVGDGDYYEVIEKLKNKLGLDRIKLTRKLPHDAVIEHVSNSIAVLLTSRYEGQSMFATEALSAGKPIIITNDNGMKDMIVDGYNGFTVKTGDSLDIAEKILKFSKLTEEQKQALGSNSKHIYEEKFSPKEVANIFASIVGLSIK